MSKTGLLGMWEVCEMVSLVSKWYWKSVRRRFWFWRTKINGQRYSRSLVVEVSIIYGGLLQALLPVFS